jgi:hypothetical protein
VDAAEWKKVEDFAIELGEKLLEQAPAIVLAVEKDKADAPHETKTDLAAAELVQGSSIAQSVDPGNAPAIAALTSVARTVVTALKTQPPAAPAATAASA